jgi:hypothetical protein
MFALPATYRSLVAAAILLAATSTGALAQNVIVMVNGEPITALDIEQRSKFIQLTTQKTQPRQEVIDELIDEKLKVKEGKRWGSGGQTGSKTSTAPRRAGCGLAPLSTKISRSPASPTPEVGYADLTWQTSCGPLPVEPAALRQGSAGGHGGTENRGEGRRRL